MNSEDIRGLLAELSARLVNSGVAAQIHVVGGSAMALLFPDDPDTRVTRDIDVSMRPAAEIGRVVSEMASELGLTPGWLNSNAAAYVPPRREARSRVDGVQVTIATIPELIAMKLAASREQDLHDLGILARHAGITDARALVDIAFDAYGEDSVTLNEDKDDYLIMATQALARAQKRPTRL